MAKTERAGRAVRPFAPWLVLLAAAGAFALTMGVRQTMGLFLSALNTSTGLGVGRISLAFALGQLWWGLTQPFAGAVADRIGTGRVILLGVALDRRDQLDVSGGLAREQRERDGQGHEGE